MDTGAYVADQQVLPGLDGDRSSETRTHEALAQHCQDVRICICHQDLGGANLSVIHAQDGFVDVA